MSSQDLLSLLAQIAVILTLARLCGALMTRLGQPAVIGEILAGIVLGARGTVQVLLQRRTRSST